MKIERAVLRQIPLRLKEYFEISSGGMQDRRRRGDPNVYHVETGRRQTGGRSVESHRATGTRVSTDHDRPTTARLDLRGEG